MKRLRIIGGPNGSGKTSLTNYLRSLPELDFGYYVNADDIQAELVKNGKLSFRQFDVESNGFAGFYEAHPLFARCEGNTFRMERHILTLEGQSPSSGYFAALIADFIRRQMLAAGVTFSFETVMSDPDKIRLLEDAKANGFRVYLYFVCTADVSINIQRVANRVMKAGHDVPVDKITSRYTRSLTQLWPAIQLVDRAYLFDNSGTAPQLVLEVTPERKGIFNLEYLPAWVRNYVISNI